MNKVAFTEAEELQNVVSITLIFTALILTFWRRNYFFKF